MIEKVALVHRPLDVRRDVEIGPAVVVVVAPGRRRRPVTAGDTLRRRDLREAAAAVVVEQEVAPVAGHEQVETPVVVVIGDARAVAAEVGRTPGGVHAELAGDVDEARAVVPEQPVQRPVLVRHEQVEPAVFVEVEPDGADRLARVVNAHVPGDVDELAALVVEQHVRRVAEGHEQIDAAVVVEIDPRHLASLALDVDAEVAGGVGEAPLAVVDIELVRHARTAGETDVEIEPAVRVRIAPRRRPRVGRVGQTGIGRDLDEPAAVVAIQPVGDPVLEADEEIEIAVVVEIGPTTRLDAGGGEEIRLDQLEARRRGRVGRIEAERLIARANAPGHRRRPDPYEPAPIPPTGSFILPVLTSRARLA